MSRTKRMAIKHYFFLSMSKSRFDPVLLLYFLKSLQKQILKYKTDYDNAINFINLKFDFIRKFIYLYFIFSYFIHKLPFKIKLNSMFSLWYL